MDRRSFFRAAACMAATPIALLPAKVSSADEKVAETTVIHHFELKGCQWERVRVEEVRRAMLRMSRVG